MGLNDWPIHESYTIAIDIGKNGCSSAILCHKQGNVIIVDDMDDSSMDKKELCNKLMDWYRKPIKELISEPQT